ncbi:hypothetical protein D3C85_1825180 [compost metagenome]
MLGGNACAFIGNQEHDMRVVLIRFNTERSAYVHRFQAVHAHIENELANFFVVKLNVRA